MKIDDLKKELKKVRAPKMDLTFPSGKTGSVSEFIKMLRQQDRKDEKFLLQKRIIPVLIGLVIFTLVLITARIQNPLMILGSFLIFSSMLVVLILFFRDYSKISKETFHTGIAQFLGEKKKRLSYWRSTPFKHYCVFTLFLIGWIMINFSNKPFIRDHGAFPFVVFIVLLIIIVLNINSERLYRKRHKKEHEPLLKMICEIQEALDEEKQDCEKG